MRSHFINKVLLDTVSTRSIGRNAPCQIIMGRLASNKLPPHSRNHCALNKSRAFHLPTTLQSISHFKWGGHTLHMYCTCMHETPGRAARDTSKQADNTAQIIKLSRTTSTVCCVQQPTCQSNVAPLYNKPQVGPKPTITSPTLRTSRDLTVWVARAGRMALYQDVHQSILTGCHASLSALPCRQADLP